MIAEIANFRQFRSRLKEYIDKALKGKNIVIKSKDREVILLSMKEYRELTGDETDYLLSSEANKKHLSEGIKQVQGGFIITAKSHRLAPFSTPGIESGVYKPLIIR